MDKNTHGKNVVFLFFLIPAIMLIIGYFIFPYPPQFLWTKQLVYIPLFIGLILLGVGYFYKEKKLGSKIKITGWILFAFYWSTQLNTLYYGEDGDLVNAFLCIAGIYVLFYIAYHEWLTLKGKEKVQCIDWAAGAACIAGLIYFGIERTSLARWLIEIVAAQSGWLLNVFAGDAEAHGVNIFYKGSFAVSIIFACTAVQSMVLFVGMILPLSKVEIKRKFYGLVITIVPIYFLNLIRNAFIAYLLGTKTTSFFMAHNIIGKGGSLIALIILLFIVIRIVPELIDQIICLTDLYKRNGPVEKFVKKYFWRKK
ncbi:MAG: archaeosortase A [Petrotogales bacterium]